MLADNGHRIAVDGVSIARKFQEAGSCLSGYTSVLTLPGQSVCLRERSWIRLSKAPEISSAAAAVQFCYQVYPDALSSAIISSSNELKQVVPFVLEAVSAVIHASTAQLYQFLHA